METEIWAKIEGWPRYSISNHGRVRSDDSGRFRKYSKRTYGYLNVRLCRDCDVGLDQKGFYVHRLVAQAFIPNPNGYATVNHIDSDPGNNHVSNLEWCTQKQNIHHAMKKRGNWLAKYRGTFVTPLLAKKEGETLRFRSAKEACIHFGKKPTTFGPVINKSIKNDWKAYGYTWSRASD